MSAQKKIPLLFDRKIVENVRGGPVRLDLPPEKALAILLRGTGLQFTRTPDGVFVIRRAPVVAREPDPVPERIAEILVVGRTTSNADVVRGEDGVQPYQVLSRDRIEGSLAHTTAELLSQQVTMNVSAPTALGSFRQISLGSYVDLNGLGTDQTLVTVDGRRMPGIPGEGNFPPTDVNAIMPSAIDRVETLSTTAGAIFGVGATGGALNIVLKRDFRGFEVSAVNGISSRGDDARRVVEAKAGFETPSGRTKAFLRVGYSHFGGDLVGSRSVGLKQQALYQSLYPGGSSVVGNAIYFQAGRGSLRFSNQYGGTSLGALSTILPLGTGTIASNVAVLAANAGKPLTGLSPDGQGSLASLQPATETLSAIASVRQKIGDSVEFFVDGVFLRDTRTLAKAALDTRSTFLLSGQNGNPFDTLISVTFPTPGLVGSQVDRYQVDRETVGAIVRLGHGWSANADFSTGEAIVTSRSTNAVAPTTGFDLLSGATFLQQVAQLVVGPSQSNHGHDRLYDANVRIGGPLMRLPGGRATLTASGEWRQDTNPGIAGTRYNASGPPSTSTGGWQRVRVLSGYLEASLPVLPSDIGFFPLRDLRLQLVARHDRYSTQVPSTGLDPSVPATLDNRAAVTSYTVGGSVKPAPWLMLRASYALGFEPPPPNQLIPQSVNVPLLIVSDPKRGGAAVHDSGLFQFRLSGNPDLRPQRAHTISLGVVFKPEFAPGLRVSFDYSSLIVAHALTSFANGNYRYFVAHESQYPGRIVRAPLTASDAAKGYTAGQILKIDTSVLDVGRQSVGAVDAALEYRQRIGAGTLTLYGRATWEPRFGIRTDPDLGSTNIAGLANSPLKIRASGGVGWAMGPWSIDAGAQFYGGYGTLYGPDLSFTSAAIAAAATDPASHIAPKAFVDLATSYTMKVAVGSKTVSIRYRLGVRNLFDHEVLPIASSSTPTIADPYSDFIGRRFEFGISAAF